MPLFEETQRFRNSLFFWIIIGPLAVLSMVFWVLHLDNEAFTPAFLAMITIFLGTTIML